MYSIEKTLLEAKKHSDAGELDEAIELLVEINEISAILIRSLKNRQAQEEFRD